MKLDMKIRRLRSLCIERLLSFTTDKIRVMFLRISMLEIILNCSVHMSLLKIFCFVGILISNFMFDV